MLTEELVREALRSVYDPEVDINVQDLGLIYEVRIEEDNHVYVKHTLTSAFCPFADDICEGIEQAVLGIEGVNSVTRELTFSPEFSMELVPEETRMIMGWY